MLSAFLQGLLLGYGACIPIGPINILIMNYALRSYKDAVVFGLGAMSADIFYLFLISFGVLQFLKTSFLLNGISILGALFLLYLAWGIFNNRHYHVKREELKKQSLLSLYLKGFSLTALNPYTIGFWLSVSVLAKQSDNGYLMILAGLILAILSWITLMPLAVYKSRHLLSDIVLTRFAFLSAIVLASFGVLLLYSVFRGAL
jgi:L-lysine exporter family protein LysE/ArgO